MVEVFIRIRVGVLVHVQVSVLVLTGVHDMVLSCEGI